MDHLGAVLQDIRALVERRIGTGRLADYNRALARVDPDKFLPVYVCFALSFGRIS